MLHIVCVKGETVWRLGPLTITFCVCVIVVTPSSNVHVIVVAPCVVIGKVTSGVPFITVPQSFVAVGVAGVTAHCPETSGKEARSKVKVVGVQNWNLFNTGK